MTFIVLRQLKNFAFFTTLALSLSIANPNLKSALAAEVGASASEGTALTIYNQNFGLVKDTRRVKLNTGVNFLRFADVAAAIDPTTVNFMSLTAPNSVVVREQNYQYDVMSPETVLGKSIGKPITFRQFSSGGERVVNGTLLNGPYASVSDINGNVSVRNQGLVVRTDSGIVLRPAGQAELQGLPAGLVSKPSLLWKLEANKAGEHQTQITYQTGGMNWRADYVAIANPDDTALDITSWVTIDNKSGASYSQASLKLIAGDVHKVQPQPRRASGYLKAGRGGAFGSPQFTEKSFAEYHLYSLAGHTDVNDNETKQLSLFNAASVPSSKQFVYEPEQNRTFYGDPGYNSPNNSKIHVKIEVANTEKNGLGMPLPKGKVRVYKKDHDGALQFVGEDRIDHTPRDEKIRLYIGDAFDLVGERKRLQIQNVNPRTQRSSFEISLRNHKDTKVTITAIEHAYGDWKILSSSHKSNKRDSHTFEFPVEVPARGEVKIEYEIETKN